jgi:hypothetical protein
MLVLMFVVVAWVARVVEMLMISFFVFVGDKARGYG